MTSSRPQCEAHTDLVATLATATERTRQLERERDDLSAAVMAIDGRFTKLTDIVDARFERMDRAVVGIKLNLAKWGGVVATLAALPVAYQVIMWIVRAAEAAP